MSLKYPLVSPHQAPLQIRYHQNSTNNNTGINIGGSLAASPRPLFIGVSFVALSIALCHYYTPHMYVGEYIVNIWKIFLDRPHVSTTQFLMLLYARISEQNKLPLI